LDDGGRGLGFRLTDVILSSSGVDSFACGNQIAYEWYSGLVAFSTNAGQRLELWKMENVLPALRTSRR
jgi:hypothetical protein